MNNVSIIGRITKDIELRATTSGLPAVSMFIAIIMEKTKTEMKDQPIFQRYMFTINRLKM